MTAREVIVIGAGIIGAATAMHCADEGLSVTVLDRGAPAGGTSSHGEGNLLVSDKGPGPELDLARRARALWPDFAARVRDELGSAFPSIEFEPKGGLVVATTEPGLAALRNFAAEQRAVGITAEDLAPEGAHELEPSLTEALAGAVWYPDDAQVQPVIATEAMLAIARTRGARVRAGVEVLAPILDGGRLVGVQTNEGPVRGDTIVVAAGPWSADVASRLGVHLPVAPRRGMVLVTTPMPQRVFHKVYDADYVGAVGSSSEGLMTSTVVESTPGGSVLIGSSREQRGFDDRVRARVLAEIAGKATRLFPFLTDAAVLRTYGGFRAFMPDHLPIIGPDPRLPGLWHATGHEGAGIGLALPTGELLAAQLTGGDAPVDPALFAPGRASLDLDRRAA